LTSSPPRGMVLGHANVEITRARSRENKRYWGRGGGRDAEMQKQSRSDGDRRRCDAVVFLTFRCSFLSVRLHGDMRIQVVECAICFLAAVPPALVHAFYFLVSPPGPFVLLRTWNWDERVNLEVVTAREVSQPPGSKEFTARQRPPIPSPRVSLNAPGDSTTNE
jgi:hypothetical protein